MAADKIDIRVDGLFTPLNVAGWVELLDFQVGYFGMQSCTINDRSKRHESLTTRIKPNSLIEISRDEFATLSFRGRVTNYIPGGVTEEGVQWKVDGPEEIFRRKICRWNDKSWWEYNQQFQQDLSSPDYLGTPDANARWTAGQMLVDVLEHQFGLNVPARVGGPAGGPIASAIPRHHPHHTSVRNPTITASFGTALDYFEQTVWDAAVIMGLLDFYEPDISFKDQPIWDVIERLVQISGDCGVFIDPTVPNRPELVVHKFSNSTTVQIHMGVRGQHVENALFRGRDDRWDFDLSDCRNTIVIQGKPTILETDPTLPELDPLSGKMDRLGTSHVWRVRNQDIVPIIPGFKATDVRNKSSNELVKFRPQLYIGDVPYTAEGVVFHHDAGLVILPTPLATSSDLRVKCQFQKPFQVKVGPQAGFCDDRPITGIGSVPRYPIPSGYDAYSLWAFEKELVLSEPDFTDGTLQLEQEDTVSYSKPPDDDADSVATGKDGKYAVLRMQQRKLAELGIDPYKLSIARNDRGFMVVLAEELQRRFRDIRVKVVLVLDRITLDNLWALNVLAVNPGLRTRIQLLNLDNNRWADADLQVMSVKINVKDDSLQLECSNNPYDVSKIPPAVWDRKRRKSQSDKQLRKIMALLDGDQAGVMGDNAPDGEPQLEGARQLGMSFADRFVRKPGFRCWAVKVTRQLDAPEEGGYAPYEGIRIDEFYQNNEYDTKIKFFNFGEVFGTSGALGVGDVVQVFPIQRDSLSIMLDQRVQQDEANVCLPGLDGFWAIIYDKVEIEIPVNISDPLFDDTEESDHCPGPDGARYFGSYSFFETHDPLESRLPSVLPKDVDDPRWRPKPKGRFGVGGECDGAIEINRSNANIHLERMIVWMHTGGIAECESSMEDSSSSIDIVGETVRGLSTRRRYWFDLNIPREDCANRYIISSSQFNDFPSS